MLYRKDFHFMPKPKGLMLCNICEVCVVVIFHSFHQEWESQIL